MNTNSLNAADTQAACPLAGTACSHEQLPGEELREGLIDRRTMLTQSMIAAASAALAACGLADLPTSTSSTPNTFTVTVSSLSSLSTVGGVALLTENGVPVAIVRTGASTFIALSRICPHRGSTITTYGSGFRCPRHRAQFDISGNWIGGQTTNNMRVFATNYDPATDTLTVS